MDIEYTATLTNPIPVTVSFVNDFSLMSWLDGITTMKDFPLVASVSYALDSSAQLSPEFMEASSVQFMKAGAMGITLVVASGDRGVWGFEGFGQKFHPEFPASSPFVTTVGASNLQTKSMVGTESAWTCSGGGFSTEFLQPSWQSEAISSYLQLARSKGMLPPTNFFNMEGRGYPDVTTIGGPTNPYCVSQGDGDHVGVSGTSGSASVIAAVFAVINNVRLAQNKPPLGFANPFLYANKQCFKDIADFTKNSCLQGTSMGYSSIAGWDPASGLGIPDFECLSKLDV